MRVKTEGDQGTKKIEGKWQQTNRSKEQEKKGKLRKSLEEMFEIFQSSQHGAGQLRRKCCEIMLKSKITAAASRKKRALRATQKDERDQSNPCVLAECECEVGARMLRIFYTLH